MRSRPLKTAGAKLEDGDLVSQLLLSLPDSYIPLATAVENINEDGLNLDLFKQRLLVEELKRADCQGKTVEDQPVAFVGHQWNKNGGKFRGKVRHKCG